MMNESAGKGKAGFMKLISILLIAAIASTTDAATPKEQVDKAKGNTSAYLLSIIQPGGAWEPPGVKDWETSCTVAIALLEAGEDPTKNAAFQAAIDRIAAGKADSVCAISLKIQLLNNRVFNGKYKKQVAFDATTLRKSTKNGTFGALHESSGNNLNTTYCAWCGLSEVSDQIPEAAWIKLSKSLRDWQWPYVKPGAPVPGYSAMPRNAAERNSGGWGGAGIGLGDASMATTAEALTILAISRERIKAKKELDAIDESMKNGWSYIDEHPIRSEYSPSSLLVFQRLGKQFNRKQIGGRNVYEDGCAMLIENASVDRMKSRSPRDIAESLLFFCRE